MNATMDMPSIAPQRSLFWQNGGYVVLEDLLSPDLHQVLLREAWSQWPHRIREEVENADTEERRGGCPPRRFATAPGEQHLDSLYQAAWIQEMLQDLTQLRLSPSGERGQYIFYTETGDYISMHRDIVSCEVVMISCLYDSQPHEQQGGTFFFYPNRQEEPLSSIRKSPEKDCFGIKLGIGQTLVLFGEKIPHGTIPIVHDQTRVVSTLCFQY